MKDSTSKLLTAILLTALTTHPSVASAQLRPAKSLCRAPEPVLFTCDVGTKTVSICGQEQGGAAYRFGRPNRIELEATNLHRAHEGWSGGGETQVYANTQTHLDIVYDRMVRTGFDDEGHYLSKMTEGLVVQSGGRTVLNRECTQPLGREPPAFDQRLLETLVPEGEYVDH